MTQSCDVRVRRDGRSDEPELEAKVLGESKYDQVTSFLMAVLCGAILVVGWLALVYVSNQAYASRVTAPLQIIEVFGGGGGSPDGTPGSTEKIDVAGADAAAMASNNEEEAGDFEEPSVQQTPGAMLDVAVEAGQSLAEVDLGAVMPSGGPVASGKRASKLGTGGPGLGFGPGDGGVPANSAGASSTSRARRPRNTPGSSMPWASRWPWSCRPTSSSMSRISRARRRPSGRLPGAATTGSISSGRAAAERSPTSRCFTKAGRRGRRERRLPVLSPRGRATAGRARGPVQGEAAGEIRVTRFTVVPSGNGYDFRSSPRKRSADSSAQPQDESSLHGNPGSPRRSGPVQFIELDARSSGLVRNELGLRRAP